MQAKYIPLSTLHCSHRRLDVIVIAINLFFKVFLPVLQVLQSVIHVCHLLLTLQSLSMFAADITGDSIQNALEAVGSGDLSKLFQFKEEEYSMRFDLFECQSGWRCQSCCA